MRINVDETLFVWLMFKKNYFPHIANKEELEKIY